MGRGVAWRGFERLANQVAFGHPAEQPSNAPCTAVVVSTGHRTAAGTRPSPDTVAASVRVPDDPGVVAGEDGGVWLFCVYVFKQTHLLLRAGDFFDKTFVLFELSLHGHYPERQQCAS